MGKVENECHLLLQCYAWDHLRMPLLEAMGEAKGIFFRNECHS